MIGVALLWFGWLGFNAGSAIRDTGTAATAFINTQLGAAGAMVTWPLVEYWRTRKVTMMGWARARWPAWWPSPPRAVRSTPPARW